MNFYEILKTKKLGRGSPDYWTQLFAEHVGGKGEWKVAGVLPLTFTATAGNAIDYTIYGNNEIGKNLLPVLDTSSPSENHGISVSVENHNVHIYGTLDVDEEAVITGWWTESATGDEIGHVGEVILTGSPNYSSTGIRLRVVEALKVAPYENIIGYDEGNGIQFTMREQAIAYTVQLVLSPDLYDEPIDEWFHIMLRPANTSPDFEPYQKGVGERTENLVEAKIAKTNINAYGQIISNPDFVTWIAPVKQGVTYTFTTDGAVYAEYTKYPVLGSVAYNNKRVTAVTTFTATIDGYIAFCTSPNYSTVMCVKGSTAPTTYIPYGYQIPILCEHTISDGISYNKDKLLYFDGSVISQPPYQTTSDFIAVTQKEITISGTSVSSINKLVRLCGYDENKTFLEKRDSSLYGAIKYSFTFALGSQVKYIKYSLYKTDINIIAKESNDYTFYIGDSPLTEGETVSKTSTGQDIELFEGENTVSTTLYNKPTMEIKYK